MGLLATVAELRIFLQDPDLDEEQARLFLTLASAEARAYTGNGFEWVEGDTIRLNGTGSPVILLPEAPVAAIIEIKAAAGTADAAVLADDSFDWDQDGVVELRRGVFFRRRRWYEVTYDHGFENIPDEVKGAVLGIAARGLENPDGVTQETLGAYSYTLAGGAAGVGLVAGDRIALDPYFISTKIREGSGTIGSGGS